MRKKINQGLRLSIIGAVKRNIRKPFQRGTRYYITRVSLGIDEGEWRVWDMLTDYTCPFYVTKKKKWMVELDPKAPTWREVREMNIWQRNNWIEPNIHRKFV